MKPLIDIIIPSFNGKYLLEKHLPFVVKNSDFLNQIIVIDNGSTDGTVSWLKENYPQIEIVRNTKNLGFTKPVNQGVSKSKAKYFVLLNNDVEPQKGYLKNILHYFEEDESTFAVSFNETGSSWPLSSLVNGQVHFTQGEDKSGPRYSLWASGGSAIYNRRIWDRLGGLNEIYAPFYWEDIDISYRAWKTGYHVLWDNGAIVDHQHEATSGKINPAYLSLIKQRNELLFNWLNLTDPGLKTANFKSLLIRALKHPGYLKIILTALLRLPYNQTHPQFIRSDREIFSKVNRKYE